MNHLPAAQTVWARVQSVSGTCYQYLDPPHGYLLANAVTTVQEVSSLS